MREYLQQSGVSFEGLDSFIGLVLINLLRHGNALLFALLPVSCKPLVENLQLRIHLGVFHHRNSLERGVEEVGQQVLGLHVQSLLLALGGAVPHLDFVDEELGEGVLGQNILLPDFAEVELGQLAGNEETVGLGLREAEFFRAAGGFNVLDGGAGVGDLLFRHPYSIAGKD